MKEPIEILKKEISWKKDCLLSNKRMLDSKQHIDIIKELLANSSDLRKEIKEFKAAIKILKENAES